MTVAVGILAFDEFAPKKQSWREENAPFALDRLEQFGEHTRRVANARERLPLSTERVQLGQTNGEQQVRVSFPR
jgi:hypothetical protein